MSRAFAEGECGHEGTFWGAGHGLDLRGGDMVCTCVKFHPSVPLRSVHVMICMLSHVSFKGRNRPMVWGEVEGKDSRSLEKVNKGRPLLRILLYFVCLRDVRGGGIFRGSP